MSNKLSVIVSALSLVVAASSAACSAEPPTTIGRTEGPLGVDAGTAAPVGTAPTATPAASGSTAPAGGACTPQSNDPCELCAVSKCCPQIDVFAADPQAKALYDCAEACQTAQTEPQYDACIQQCETRSPSAAAKSKAVDACVQAGCAAQCPQS